MVLSLGLALLKTCEHDFPRKLPGVVPLPGSATEKSRRASKTRSKQAASLKDCTR